MQNKTYDTQNITATIPEYDNEEIMIYTKSFNFGFLEKMQDKTLDLCIVPLKRGILRLPIINIHEEISNSNHEVNSNLNFIISH